MYIFFVFFLIIIFTNQSIFILNENKLSIGTSGYSYEDWREVFYPKDLPKNKMLEFYTQHFNTVEINATYYTIPKYSVFERLVQKTPSDFEFIIKVNKETTHVRKENEKAISSFHMLYVQGSPKGAADSR